MGGDVGRSWALLASIVFVLWVALGPALSSGETGCTDSDGADYYTKGTVTVEDVRSDDACSGSSVMESVCSTHENVTSIERISFPCPYGCRDGACIRQSEAVCPSSIDISSSKDTYHAGETGIIMIVVRDASGSPMPNTTFYVNFTYRGSRSSTSFTTNSTGGYYSSGVVSNDMNGTYEYTVYTASWEGCASNSDKIAITFVQETQNCKKEGETIGPQEQIYCCPGLNKMSNPAGYNSDCSSAATGNGFVCTRCGDGVCGNGESKCNCPLDCGKAACTDSDGGRNYYLRGSLDMNCAPGAACGAWVDSCRDSITLLEYSCENTNGELYACPNGCSDGACLKEKCQTLWWFDNQHSYCQQKSFCGAYMYYGLRTFATEAECRANLPNATTCRDESYGCYSGDLPCCTGLKAVPMAIAGAADGLCATATCGSICRPCGNGKCDSNENKCNCPDDCGSQACANKCGDGVCNEFVCVGSECPCVETAVTCPKDCGVQETCSDTDNGNNLFVRGTVSYWRPGYSQKYSDYCFSDYRYVMEYYCGKDVSPAGSGMTAMSFACPEGYICRDGACVQSAIPYGCPSSIYIAFDRNEYRFGDTVYVKVGVWDANSRGVPNARIWVEGKYNGVRMGLSSLTMDANGMYYTSSTVSMMQQGVYEYTASYNESGCPAISAGTKIMVYNTTAQRCKDSDGGIDYYTKGMASQCPDSPQSTCRAFEDQCTSSNVVREGFCKGDDLVDTEYTCPYGCRDGACLKSGNVTQVGFRNAYWQCYDGKESNEGGETSCKTSETWRKYAEEFCSGRCAGMTECEAQKAVATTTTAAYSTETPTSSAGGGGGTAVPTSTQTPAPSVGGGGGTSVKCIGGKCGVNTFKVWNECDTGIVVGCTDSDGGKEAYVAGKTWMGNNVHEDICYDKSVIEYYCSYDSATNTEFIKKEEIPCPSGCANGACINEKKNDCAANGYYCVDASAGCGETPAMQGYTCGTNEVCCLSKPPSYEEKIKVKIDRGWNLIAIPGTFSVDKGTCSQPEKWAFFWWYTPEKRFIGMKDVEKMTSWDFKKTAFWAYSPEECQMEFRVMSGSEYYSIDSLPQLYAGWNMVAITKDMLGSKLDDIKGDCEVKGAYVFDGMKWKIMGEQVVPASLESLGHGMVVNVANDCRLGVVSITPPAFPTGMLIAV